MAKHDQLLRELDAERAARLEAERRLSRVHERLTELRRDVDAARGRLHDLWRRNDEFLRRAGVGR